MHPFLEKWYQFCPHCQQPLQAVGEGIGCLACGFRAYANPAPCVTVLVEKSAPRSGSEPELLLVKRAIEPFKDWWDLPGGFIQPGETVEQATLREIKEETNLDVTITKVLGNIPDIYNLTPTLPFIVVVQAASDQVTAADDVSSAQWFTTSARPDRIAFAHTKTALQWYDEYQKSRGKKS